MHTLGDPAGSEIIDTPLYCTVLKQEQLNRAIDLGFPKARIEGLETITRYNIDTLREIINNTNYTKANEYLRRIKDFYITDESYSEPADGIPKNEIQLLIELIFSKENIRFGIPYMLAFFAEFIDPQLQEQTINIRMSIGLLDHWRGLGQDHELFGKIPTKDSEGVSVFACYISYREQGICYYTVPELEDKKVKGRDYIVTPTIEIPDTFARIGIYSGADDTDIVLDIAHYETIYVLGGSIYESLRPSVKGLNGFIRKHQQLLFQDGKTPWDNLKTGKEGAWRGAKRFLNIQRIPQGGIKGEAKKGIKKKGGALSIHRNPTIDSVTLTSGSGHPKGTQSLANGSENTRNIVPVLFAQMHYVLESGGQVTKRTEEITPNLPINSILWIGIGEPVSWATYKRGEVFSIDAPSAKTTYIFCFTEDTLEGESPPDDTSRYPHTEITIIPRLAPSPPPPPNTTAQVAKGVQGAVSKQIPPPSPPAAKSTIDSPEDKTDDIVLEIIGFFDNPHNHPLTITLSTRIDGTIVGTLSTDPTISFEIATDDAIIFGPKDIIDVDLARLQLELGTYLPSLIRQARSRIEEKKQGEIDTLLLRLSGISRFITHCRELFLEGENDRNSISEIAEECEINGNYSGSIFANRLNAGKLQAFQAILEQKGISLKLIRISEGGFDHKIQICLSDDDQTIYDVSRSQDAPYYHIQKSGPDQDKQVSGFVRALALDVYIILGRAGLQIFKPQNTPIGDSSGLSAKEIGSILDGTYEKPKRTFGNLEESEKRLIAQAATRVKEGRLRTLKEEASNLSLGIIVGAISTAKNIGDFHALNDEDHIILTDEKLSCLPKEKTKGRIEKWKKRNKGKKISISDHPYKEEYSLLKYHPRSRKYWVRRMIASVQTIAANSRCRYLGLTPFKNEMMVYFGEFWNGLSDEKKREFLIAAANGGSGKPSKALSVLGDDGKNLFDSFILGAEEKYIPIGYSKPQKITKGEILEFIQSEDYKEWSTKIQAGIDLLEEDVFEETPDVE